MTALLSRRNETKTDDVQQQTASMQCFNHQDASAYAKGSGETGRTPRFQPQMNTDFPSAACAATTDFGLRRESRRAHTRQLKGLMFKFFEAAWDRRLEALKD
jgi:hypothetical protein